MLWLNGMAVWQCCSPQVHFFLIAIRRLLRFDNSFSVNIKLWNSEFLCIAVWTFCTRQYPQLLVLFSSQSSPDNEPISYICLKSLTTNEDSFRIIIEPHDISEIDPVDALDNTVWSIKMWGGTRDQELIRRLRSKKTLGKLETEDTIINTEGNCMG